MNLQSLDVTARGQSRRITFAKAVTIMSAPNGSGKSTALACLEFAMKGTVTVDGKPRKKEGDIFAHLSAGGEPVAVNAVFDCATIARGLTGTDTGAKQALHFSGCQPSTKIDVAQGAIIATLGDLARVDVADLLSKGPTDRRAAVLGLCRQFARPWTLAELREAFTKAGGGETFVFKPDAALGLLASLERDAAAAKQTVLDADKQVKALQQAIDRMAEHAADNAEPGDPEAMATRIRDIGTEIERLSGEVASIDAANQSASTIARRLDELAQLPPVERAQADLGKAREAYAGLLAEKAVLSPPRAPVEPVEIADLRRQVEEQEAILSRAGFEAEQARKRADALKHLIAHADGADCPTCRRPMDESAIEALELAMSAEDGAARGAVFRMENAGPVVECLRADLQDMLQTHVEATEDYSVARTGHSLKVAYYVAAEAEKRRLITEAEALLARCQSAGAERADLHDRRAKLATGDTDMLRNQISGATKERADLTERRDRVIQDAARQQAYREQIANRDELKESIPSLKAAAAAWKQVVNEVAESAIAPFVEACNAGLPDGWTMSFDVATADFAVTRRDVFMELRPGDGAYHAIGPLSVPFSALSGGEKVMAVAAMAVALAKCAGNPWKAVILDACEQIMGADWQDPAYPDGLFAAFVQRLASAAEAGLIDQVIMATSRRLAGREGAAIRGVAQVVEMGVVLQSSSISAPDAEECADDPPEPAPLQTSSQSSSPDDSLPWSAPSDFAEAEAIAARAEMVAEKPRAKAIREALKSASAEACRLLYESLVGTETRSTGVTVKRVVNERFQESGERLDVILGWIESAKAAHPPKARAVGEEAVA